MNLFNFLRTKGTIEKKNKAELNFWQERFALKGGKLYWRNIYFQLYCHYLEIEKNSFRDKVFVDIGCGPHGASGCFEAKIKFGIDPLVDIYNQEFNLHDQPDVIYLNCGAEKIPLINGFVDAVISRNAIDHIDNVEEVISEVHRILHKGGEIHFAVNYQEDSTVCEPNVLNDEIVRNLLNGKFDYEIKKRFPKNYDSEIGGVGQFKYPHEIVLINGNKI